jgi:3-methylcrotonyl-CoA carboxylase beta subunit
VAEDDDHAITILRDIAGTFAPQTMASVNLQPPRPPRYDPCEFTASFRRMFARPMMCAK